MNGNRAIRFIIVMEMLLLLTGCWNQRELKDLAIVMAMGVDKGPKTGEYRVSFQIVNPGTVATGERGGGGATSSTPVTVYSGTGSTLFEAVRKTSKKIPRQLFFSHSQLLIIGETLARDGIRDLFDFFERSHEARPTTIVLVSRGSDAESIIKTLTPLEKIPANGIAGKIKMTSKVWSENIKVEIDDIIKSFVSEGATIISGVEIVGRPEAGDEKSNLEQTKLPGEIDITGIAIFKDGKLKRWLNGDEGRGSLWILNKMKSTIVNLDYKDKKAAVGVEIVQSQTNVNAKVQAGKPVFDVHIRETGNVNEVKAPIDLSKTEEITKLERELETETKKKVMKAIKAAQSQESDIFHFWEALNRAEPALGERYKKDWGKTFAESKVDVKVEAFIRRSGMRLKPYISEK